MQFRGCTCVSKFILYLYQVYYLLFMRIWGFGFMALTVELIEEINILAHYNLASIQEGIKVHGSAKPEVVEATKRLFDKGLISQSDGGYLTDLGIEAAEHAQAALRILLN